MTNSTVTEYRPTSVTPPGETLAEILTERGMTQADLASRMARPPKLVNEIIKGKTRITEETAIELERTLSVSAAFWLARQTRYREWVERRRAVVSLAKDADWLDEIPVREMERRGWIEPSKDPATRVDRSLQFFGVASVDAWRSQYAQHSAAFRASPSIQAAHGAVATWLRRGEVEAAQIKCARFHEARFRSAIQSARSLTNEGDPDAFVPALRDACAGAGVALVLVRAFPGCPMSGATRWLTPTKALLMLSARYRSDDQLWFSFFHEAGHILLHGKRLMFVDGGKQGHDTDAEKEADRFAADHLIPIQHLRELNSLASASAIIAFAKRIGVGPGIVVGRLQHDRGCFNRFNELKVRYDWDD